MNPDDRDSGTVAASPEQNQQSAVISAVPRLAPLQIAERYELQGLLAQGGMGVIHEAWDKVLSRSVAVKFIKDHAVSPVSIKRFLDEATITGQLQHPSIPPIYDVGQLPSGNPFLAMKLIQGHTLDYLIKTDRQAIDVSAVFEAICQAIGYAHNRGLIHRDLKPSNVMVGAFGEVQVMDWGLATALRTSSVSELLLSSFECLDLDQPPPAEGQPTVTALGNVVGTPAYMPPEQAQGATNQVDQRSDVFGLGGILCALLTGQAPFRGGNSETLRSMAAAGDVADAFARLDACGADAGLIALAKQCLAADRTARPANGLEVAQRVAKLRQDADARARAAELAKATVEARRRVFAWSAAVVCLVLSGGVIVSLRQLDQVRSAERATAAQLALTREAEAVAVDREHKATAARDRTREVLDVMVSDTTGDSLGTQAEITAEQKRFLGAVLGYYQEFSAEDPADEPSRYRRARAALQVGRIESRLGRTEQAVAAFRLARDGCEKLVREVPTSADYRQSLAQCRNSLGVVLDILGRRAEAEAEFRAAVAGHESVVADRPTNVTARQLLGNSRNSLGAVLFGLGKRAEAETEYRRALAIRDQLAAEAADVPAFRQAAAASHFNLGLLLANNGRPTEAVAEYLKAQDIQQRLTAEFPTTAEYGRLLSNAHNQLGNVYLGQGQRGKATEEFQQSLVLMNKLATDFPAVPAYRSELGTVHYNLARAYSASNRVAESERAYRTALAVRERLSADFPAVPEYRRALAMTHNALGVLLVSRGQLAEAEAEYRRALVVREKLVAEEPDVPGYRIELGGSYTNLGRTLADRDSPAWFRWFDRAIALVQPVYEQNPQNVAARTTLRNAYWNRAEAHARRAAFSAAVADYDRALALATNEEKATQRAGVVLTRAKAGQLEQAAREVAELTTAGEWPPNRWYEFAVVSALADPSAKNDRAMELLRKAAVGGYAIGSAIRSAPEFAGLRTRGDFERLMAKFPREPAPLPRSAK